MNDKIILLETDLGHKVVMTQDALIDLQQSSIELSKKEYDLIFKDYAKQ